MTLNERHAKEKSRIVFMFDFDGTLFKTMHLHANLASELMKKYFGMSREKAKKEYLASSGISFSKQLDKIFPNENPRKREACIKEYNERRIKEVFEVAELFPEIRETLNQLKEQLLVVSSGNDERIINKLLKDKGINGYFQQVYGSQSGLKEKHIKTLMQEYHPTLIVFIGDSPYDMQLSRENIITVGKAGRPEESMLSKEELIRHGADIATKDLKTIAKALKLGQVTLSSFNKKELLEILRKEEGI